MELQKLKELLKTHNHLLIDYTDKFINTDYEISLGNNKYISRASQIYLEIDDKTKQDKYKNVVFLLDISKLVKYNKRFYNLLVKNKEIIITSTNLYLIKNSENYCVFLKDNIDKYKKMIIEVINKKTSSYTCDVCYEEKPTWNELEYCDICNFRTCIKCIIKAEDLNKKCFSCRVETNNKYNIIYDLLSKFVEQ